MYFYYNYKDAGFYESDVGELWNPLLIAEDPAEVLPVNNQNIFYNRNCKRGCYEYQSLGKLINLYFFSIYPKPK